MGIVIGVEAAVAVAEAAEAAAAAGEAAAVAGEAAAAAGEAAAAAGEAIGSAAEAGEAIGTAAEAGEAAGAEAGEGAAAAAESEGGALQTALDMLTSAVGKLGKMVVEFGIIDLTFRAAKALLEPLFATDSSARIRAEKLAKLIEVLNESSTLMKNLTDWLKVHSQDTTDLKDFTVTTQGVLSKFISKLGAAAGVLQKLSKQISQENDKKQTIKDGEIDAIEHSLQTMLNSFKSLAEFKEKHKGQVSNLDGMPIDEKMVAAMQAKLP